MAFRLIADEYDFNLLDFDKQFVVGASDGLAQYLSVEAPPGQNYDLEFGPTETLPKLGQITIRHDGGFTYVPNGSRWRSDCNRIDHVEYWVQIRGRDIRTTGRFAIKQGRSIEKRDVSKCKLPKPIGEYLLDGGNRSAKLVTKWLHERGHAKSGSRLVILSASESSEEGAYEDFREEDMPFWGTIQSFVVNTTKVANNLSVSKAIEDATAIFIEGGNQVRYLSIWNGTKLHKALKDCFIRRVPIGGSSAGMAILGGVILLPPMVGNNIESAEALSNPLNVLPAIRLSKKPFLEVPFLKGVYLETHFKARQRLGRTAAVLAISNTANRAIMAEEGTALSINVGGIGKVVGKDRVYFAELTARTRKLIADSALTTDDIKVVAMKEGDGEFNLEKWTPESNSNCVTTTFRVDRGLVVPTDEARKEWYNDYADAAVVEDSLSRQLNSRVE